MQSAVLFAATGVRNNPKQSLHPCCTYLTAHILRCLKCDSCAVGIVASLARRWSHLQKSWRRYPCHVDHKAMACHQCQSQSTSDVYRAPGRAPTRCSTYLVCQGYRGRYTKLGLTAGKRCSVSNRLCYKGYTLHASHAPAPVARCRTGTVLVPRQYMYVRIYVCQVYRVLCAPAT